MQARLGTESAGSASRERSVRWRPLRLRCHPNATVYLATNSALLLLGPKLQATLRADTVDGDLD
jgi:hypothetical protein